MLAVMNTVAMVIGYIVLVIIVAYLGLLCSGLVGGLRQSLDYHRWVVRNAKHVGTYESHIKGRRWAYVKSVARHSLEFADMIEGDSIIRTRHGWWQHRGNWIDADGKKGPRFNADTEAMR